MIIEQLSSLPDDTSALEPWCLSNDEIRGLAEVVFRARAGLEELATRLASAAEDRDMPREDGCTSTTAWLAKIAGISRTDAAKLVALSRVPVCDAEPTRSAWSHGSITTEQAGVIIRAIEALPDWFGEEERRDAEQVMLQHAPHLTIEDLRRLGNHVVEVLDPDGAEEIIGRQLAEQEKRAFDGARLIMRDDGHGTTQLKGQIPTAQGAMLRTALEGLASPRRRAHRIDPDGRGPHGDPALGHPHHDQRIGWAFLELIEHLPTAALPQAGGLPAVVTIETSLDTLISGLGTAGLSTGDEISAGEARRLACNAGIIPVVMGGDSTILDMAPTRRLHDRHQRHAIVKRDGGCCWKGCERPPAWCEVHHPEPYAGGGPTTVDNGALFCFIHHHLLHDADWHARLAPDGVIEVIPPERIDPHQRPLRHARHTKLQPRAA
ncbi:DUF222 domain-containing protein [Aeromicrobium sp.]|uniref:HNH endonuclease n=1 Tax=Aeromicrobium sp. TaxID=1871063 RepID=UPI0030C561A9